MCAATETDCREEMIERLQDSRQVRINIMREQGNGFGVAWAECQAEYGDLIRLAAFIEENRPSGFWALDTSQHHRGIATPAECRAMAETLFEVIDPDVMPDLRSDSAVYWEWVFCNGYTRENMESPAFLLGFCEGAMVAWNDVRDRL